MAQGIVVGAGLMGGWHAHAIVRGAGGQVAGIVDPDRAKARALAARHPGARVYLSLEEAMADCPAPVVHICTPLLTHAPLAELALRADRHVLVEKPLAPTIAQTETLLALARYRNLRLNPVHQFGWQRGFVSLLAQKHCLGAPVRLHYSACTAGAEGRSGEACRRVLLEILPHPVGLFSRLLGPGFVAASLQVVRCTEEDLEMSGLCDGTWLSVQLSLRGRPTHNLLTVIGTNATAHLDLYHGYLLLEGGATNRWTKFSRPFKLSAGHFAAAATNLGIRALQGEPAYPGLNELVRLFHRSVLAGSPAPVPEQEIRTAAAVLERAEAAGCLP